MKEIFDKKDYREHFEKFINVQSDKEKKSCNKVDLEKVLLQALEIRKFEIELYWKRATYFWAFIAVAFAGYFAILNSDNIDNHKSITIAISIIGLLFSLGWYLVNRGSKYWQSNWESHVAMLENEIIGPLFKTVRNPNKSSFKNITGEYPFSVSKINQILSFVVLLIWVYLVAYSVSFTFGITYEYADILNVIYFAFVFITAITLFVLKAESGVSKDIKAEIKKRKAELISFEE